MVSPRNFWSSSFKLVFVLTISIVVVLAESQNGGHHVHGHGAHAAINLRHDEERHESDNTATSQNDESQFQHEEIIDNDLERRPPSDKTRTSGGSHDVTDDDEYDLLRHNEASTSTSVAALCPWNLVRVTVNLPTSLHEGHAHRHKRRHFVLHEARLLTGGCGNSSCTGGCSQLGSQFGCEPVRYSVPVDERREFSVVLTVGFTCARLPQ